MEEQDLVSGKVPNDCNCGRGDWVYDSDVGMWCCGCGYVKHATGKGFKDGRYKLDSKRCVVESSNDEVRDRRPAASDSREAHNGGSLH